MFCPSSCLWIKWGILCNIWFPSLLAQTTPSLRPSPTPTSQSPERLKFRLAGHPRKHNEGRIEVFYKGEWGTICDDDFSLANANVLCRQLGFVSATGWAHSAKYGKGSGKIWLDNIQCSGSERSISVCKSRGWGNSDCTHDEDAGVICKDERLPGFVDSNVIEVDERKVEEVRLRPVVTTASRRLPVTEGVVEVKYKDSWVQVCDNGWTPKNSRVVCGMMGFPHERKVNKNFYKLYAERQKNYYFVHSVACLGTEVHLAACPLEFNQGNATETCAGGMPAAVSCVPGPEYAQNRAMKKKLKTSSTVRLKGGARPGEGRVEVLKGSEWGTVCDDRWNLQAASVVCREMGYGSAKLALTGARMGQGIGPIHMNEVQCTGHERSLLNCNFKNITAEDCKHTEDAAVRCNVPYMGYEKTETWYWDGSNVTDMVMSGVKCTGDELSLSQCQHHKTVSCQKSGARFSAGVICSETASDLVLNAPLVQQSVYIEDRPLHMLYCAAEENCLSSTASKANWPYGHRRLLRFSSEIHNIGRADFRPKAGRHSWVWHACHGHYHSMDIFTHYDLLSINGTKVAEGHKASFCLEDNECQEGVSKRYECANFGEQGITVGCRDLYRHDIDCQWIDITDVKPGNYILQIVINPNYEVSESDFTNNGMKCNCKYDGHRIWLHNCHTGDSFSEEAERKFEKYPGQINNQIS
uniref:Lysyl oxidase homolog n=1 Tax=Astyanax mexicanus TaxID=7994 RepID=A0A8B9JBM7_ASTMX